MKAPETEKTRLFSLGHLGEAQDTDPMLGAYGPHDAHVHDMGQHGANVTSSAMSTANHFCSTPSSPSGSGGDDRGPH